MNPLADNADSLDGLRQQIDQLDNRLLALLAQRQQLVQQIAAHKTGPQSVPAYDRLLPMLRARGERAAALGLDRDFIVRLFQQIAHQAMAVQRSRMAEGAAPPPAAATAPVAAARSSLPLVYSCSGCSSSAQLANDLALALDREQLAEMSCIAGVGGDVPALVKTATSGRAIVAIDGCGRVCAKRSLERHGVTPDQHVILSQWGAKKVLHRHYLADELLIAKAKLHDCLSRLQEAPSVAANHLGKAHNQHEEPL